MNMTNIIAYMETAVILLFHKHQLMTESGFTETLHLACVQCLSDQKLDCICSPAVNFVQLMKNKLMWNLHI